MNVTIHGDLLNVLIWLIDSSDLQGLCLHQILRPVEFWALVKETFHSTRQCLNQLMGNNMKDVYDTAQFVHPEQQRQCDAWEMVTYISGEHGLWSVYLCSCQFSNCSCHRTQSK